MQQKCDKNANYYSNARSKARAQDTLLDGIQYNERCMCRIECGGKEEKWKRGSCGSRALGAR